LAIQELHCSLENGAFLCGERTSIFYGMNRDAALSSDILRAFNVQKRPQAQDRGMKALLFKLAALLAALIVTKYTERLYSDL
jgi:hypothetical protein